MRGETARLEGDAIPFHPGQEGGTLAGPPLARRSGSEKRVRTSLLALRLTADERALIDRSAERAGLTTASYARRTLLGATTPRQVRRPPVERQELARLLGHMGQLGNNINQIARVLNGGSEFDEKGHRAALSALQEMRKAVLAALRPGLTTTR